MKPKSSQVPTFLIRFVSDLMGRVTGLPSPLMVAYQLKRTSIRLNEIVPYLIQLFGISWANQFRRYI